MTQYLSKRTWGNKNTRLCHAHQSPDLQDFHPCKKEVGCIVATSKVPSQSSEPFAEVREDGHAGGSWQPHKFPGASKNLVWRWESHALFMLCCDSVYIYTIMIDYCDDKGKYIKTELHICTYVVFGSVIEVVNSEKDDKHM